MVSGLEGRRKAEDWLSRKPVHGWSPELKSTHSLQGEVCPLSLQACWKMKNESSSRVKKKKSGSLPTSSDMRVSRPRRATQDQHPDPNSMEQLDSTPMRHSKIRAARESPVSLTMSEHQRARSPRRRWRCPSTEERGVPGITGDVRAPRSEEAPVSLAMSEHRGTRSPRHH